MTQENRQCQNCKTQFTIEPEDFDFYKKIDVPPPTWCWKCRAMRRMCFKGMNTLYERTCAATGKKIYTQLPPGAPMPAYDNDYWASDAWDPMSYGRDYDFTRPFFEQLKDLYHEVPWGVLWSMGKINSDYSVSSWAKNCYLCFDSGYLEDSAYSVTLLRSKECMDMINCKGSELCYYSINLTDCHKTLFSQDCTSCSEVWFSRDCVGCSNCFGCNGLRNKQYYIFNEPYSKEAYQSKLAGMDLDSWSGIQKARQTTRASWLKFPVKFRHSIQVSDSTGDYIYNAKKLKQCFFVGTAENLSYCQSVIYDPNKDGMDMTSAEGTEFCYEVIDTGSRTYQSFFSLESVLISDCRYVIDCHQASNSFGCVALKNKEYCILNKQYSKEEYHKMVPKIIQHMNDMPYTDAQGREYKYGEFLPPELSPFSYIESQAHQYFPLAELEIKEQGFNWRNSEKKNHSITKTPDTLPNSIQDIHDEITKEVIQCEHDKNKNHSKMCQDTCATAFRIIPQEIAFYKRMNLPLPRMCFFCRHFDRVAWRNRPQLFSRQCLCEGSETNKYRNTIEHFHGEEKCPNKFETSYSVDRPELVYCEQCYQAEVV